MERFMMNVIYIIDTNDKYKNKGTEKEFYFRVLLHYTMHQDVRHMFSTRQFGSQIELIL